MIRDENSTYNQTGFKTALSIVMNCRIPMCLYWGPELTPFHNTAFEPLADYHLSAWEKIKPIIRAMREGAAPVRLEDQLLPVYKNGHAEHIYLTSSYSPVLEGDEVAGVLVTCFETTGEIDCLKKITERDDKEVAEIIASHLAVSNAEERLRLACEATGIGSWDIDLKENTIIYTPTLMELFGLSRDFILNLEDLNSLIYVDDKLLVDNALKNALTTGYYYYEARVLWPDESIHWIRANGKVIFDDDGLPARLLGTTIDITENKIEQIEKNDFIAIASHELKTPLTSVKAYIQMLKSGKRLEEPGYILNLATRAEVQVNKMTKLIYSFLDMSRIESGNIDMLMEPFMLDDLISDVIKDYVIHTNTHVLAFEPGISSMIDGDRSRIGQVIDNLVSNAIKYSPLSKRVEISSSVVGEEAIVSVKDFGIGIDAKHQAKVFERFYRADDQKARNASGFGIGLYLSADILKRHNGGIWIDSRPGEGTTFHFSLPMNQA